MLALKPGMFSLARCESIVKALFRVPAAWIKNGQPKIVSVLQCHYGISTRITQPSSFLN